MTEQYGFRFVVDANDAAKGWKQFESAVDGVFRSLDRMESHVEKTMGAVNKATQGGKRNIAAFTKAAQELGRVKVNPTASRNIAALNAAMKSFKAPSAAQVRNTNAFFRALDKSGTGGGATAARNIAALSVAMRGFKAPTASNVTNLRELFKALALYPSGKNFTNAAGMLSTLRQLSGFKAPTAAQVRNLQQFLNTVANLRIPQNGAQIARNLEQIARAATVANRDLRGLRSNIGSFNFGRFNAGVRGATVNMMGLQNAFSATYQMGSILRSLLGSLTIAELGRSFFEADNRLQTFNASMKVISEDAAFANTQLQFVSDTAVRLGLDYGAAATAFSKFAISSHTAGASAAQARDIFEGFGTAMTVMGLAADKQNDVMLALQQVMNKGYLAGEELNQQLNEHLPGALGYLREELAKTGVTLEDALKGKMIDATQGLLFLASKYREEFGPALEDALNRPAAQMNILRTNISKLYEAMAENGMNDAFVDLLKRINAYMRPEDIAEYGKAMGEFLARQVDKLTAAIDWLFRNWDRLKGPLAVSLDLIAKWAIISGTLQIGKFLVGPIIGATSAFRAFIPVASQSLLLMRAMTATSFVGLAASVRGMNPATLALLTNIRGISNATKTFAKNPFTGMRTGLASIGTMTEGVAGKFLKLGGVIGAGLTIAMGVARDANKEYAHDSFTTTEIVKGFFLTLGDNIASMWTATTEFMANKFGWVGSAISGTVSWLQDFFKAFFINLSFGFSKVGQGIYLTFKSAFDAVVGMIRNTGTALYKLFTGDFAGAGQAAMNVFSAPFSAFQSNFSGFATDLPGQRDQFATNVERGYSVVSDQLARYGERGRGSTSPRERAADVSAQEMLDSLYTGDILREGAADEDGKKNKGRKGPKPKDPIKELERLQRKADQIMKRLAEDNPLLKLQQEYVEDLTRQAQTLLTDGGYERWMQQIASHGGDAAAVMMELQDALNGSGADQAVLNDLTARYGVSVNDLNEALEHQLAIYNRRRLAAEREMTFGGELLKQKKEELQLARASSSQQQILSEVMQEVNRWRDLGKDITQEEIDLLTEQLTLQQRRIELLNAEREFYENNGLRQYQNDIRTVGEMIHDLDKDFLGSLEEQLFSVGTTGKFSFSAIFDTIQQGLVRWSAQGITNAIGGLLSDGDSQNPTIFGGLMKSMGFGNTGFDSAVANQRIDAQNVILYGARVNTNGDLFGAGFGQSLGNSGGIGPNGEIIVNGNKPWDLQDELSRPLISATEQVGEMMSQDWGQQIRGLGPMFGSLLQGLGMGGGGGGGLAGGLLNIGMSLLGGGGNPLSALVPSVNAAMAANPGIFKEGGYSTQPVTRWSNAPHYSEGTHNTTPGIPAVLHDNEAVIPLSRGRKVPVTLTNGGGNGSGTVINNNWNIQTPNADSFRRSQQQMTGQMHRAAQRAYIRNN